MTVLEACKSMGLAYSQLTLSVIGKHIATRYYFIKPVPFKYQQENGQWIEVRNYPDDTWLKEEIKKFINRSWSKNYIDFLMNKVEKDVYHKTRFKNELPSPS